jgi:hypothetical protein
MSERQKNIFTIACDMDDVLMVPHTYIEFSKYLEIYEQFSVPLVEYKNGKRSYNSLWENWYKIINQFTTIEKRAAINDVAEKISVNTYRFVENSKKLGRFIIVSNNDGDLVKAIAEKFDVEYIAVNKYIFEYCLDTQKKSEAIKKHNIIIDAAVTDDPVNEKDFLDLPLGNRINRSCGIVIRRNDMPPESYNTAAGYKVVNTLDEVLTELLLIKDELKRK